MEILRGFLFTIGGVAGFIFTMFLFLVFLKLYRKPHNATVKVWKDYINDLVGAGKYEEAHAITRMIFGKKDDEEIKTPAEYKVEVGRDIIIDETGENNSKIKFIKNYKIKRKNDK